MANGCKLREKNLRLLGDLAVFFQFFNISILEQKKSKISVKILEKARVGRIVS
jgi:hypothetical protein